MNSVSVPASTDWPVTPAPVPAVLVALLTLAAIMAIALSGLSPLYRFLLSLGVLAYAGWHVFRLVVPRWAILKADAEGAMLLNRQGEAYSIRLDTRSFVSPLYLGFSCRSQATGRSVPVGLFRPQLPEEAFRRLSVRLREGSAA